MMPFNPSLAGMAVETCRDVYHSVNQVAFNPSLAGMAVETCIFASLFELYILLSTHP